MRFVVDQEMLYDITIPENGVWHAGTRMDGMVLYYVTGEVDGVDWRFLHTRMPVKVEAGSCILWEETSSSPAIRRPFFVPPGATWGFIGPPGAKLAVWGESGVKSVQDTPAEAAVNPDVASPLTVDIHWWPEL